MGIAPRIRVGHAGRDDVRVVIHTIPNLPEGINGLLGLSFFDRFMVRLDHSQRELHLTLSHIHPNNCNLKSLLDSLQRQYGNTTCC